jgi:cation diffusion facilitator family transporter
MVRNIRSVLVIAFISLIIIGSIEVFAGIFINSIAVTSDAVDSFLDAVVVLFVWFGLNIMRKKSDDVFSYGYFRVENLFSLFAAILMFATGLGIGYFSYLRLSSPIEVTYPLIVTIIVIFNGCWSTMLALFMRSTAKRDGLHSVKVASLNSVKDATSSFVVLGVIALGAYEPHIDAIGGLILAVYICSVGYAEVHEASMVLVDALEDPKLKDQIETIINTAHRNITVERIRPRRSGPYIFLNILLEGDPTLTLDEVGKIKNNLDTAIRTALPVVRTITFDFRPKTPVNPTQS